MPRGSAQRMEKRLEQPPYFEKKRRIIRACGHVSCPLPPRGADPRPPLQKTARWNHYQRDPQRQLSIIDILGIRASWPARARALPALSLRGPPQHDLKCDCAWDRSSCRRTRARRPGSRRGQALSWPARARPRPCQIQLWWPTQLLRRVQDGARACAGRRPAAGPSTICSSFLYFFFNTIKKVLPATQIWAIMLVDARYGRLC